MNILLNSFHLIGHTPDLKVTITLNSTVLSSYINMLQDAIQSLEQTTDNGYHLSVSELTIIYFLSQAIEQNLKKLIFYYGATDHWAPVSYYEDMKKNFLMGRYIFVKGSLTMHLFWNLRRKSLKWLHLGYKK